MGKSNYSAVSLFSASGIGDIGFKKAGLDFLLMCEIEYDRSRLLGLNFQNSKIIDKDIYEAREKIIDEVKRYCLKNDTDLFLISCTAPCQGMSKSGQGKLLQGIREGKRPKLDPRNRLILPALDIIKALRPLFIVFENVCEMKNTIIEDADGKLRPILKIIKDYLGEEYFGEAYDVEFADYGVPQRRKRLITVFTRDKKAIENYKLGISLIPKSTHSKYHKDNKKPWVSVAEALKSFPKLDAKAKELASCANIPFHRVPILDPKKYEWIKNTPVNSSAFDNQCINPKCRYQFNKTHGASKNKHGINQTHKDTPLYCEKCAQLLPRPYVKLKNGKLRIMSGYTSAYKRMDPELPCPAITRNISFPCSDHKVHPFENRVLSLAEAFVIQSLDKYDYKWGPIEGRNKKIIESALDTLIRESLGESIPPKFTELLGKHLLKLRTKEFRSELKEFQGSFF